jgi:hypothetical protein
MNRAVLWRVESVEGCGMPISIVGSNGGSFRKLNLQISQTIESLQLICNSLNQSEKRWWLSHNMLHAINETKSSKMMERKFKDQVDLPLDGWQMRNTDIEEEEDDELIDLQANGD